MQLTVDQIIDAAMLLSNDSKTSIIEKLIESIDNNIDSEIEEAHIKEAKKRRDEIRSGMINTISGNEALAKVRDMVEK